jgi:Holliday junction resolvase RusA-like endonuclease
MWVKFGDANTKFFDPKATIKYRQNHITLLQDEQGKEHIDHDVKATILWRTFKNKLGIVVPPT